MNNKTRALFLAIPLGVAFLALAGCELIVDFDRTLIPADATDSSVTPKDAQADTSAPDATTDAAMDATTDATTDAGSDAADGATSDASDASSDAADASD
jgi:hypothetical protein